MDLKDKKIAIVCDWIKDWWWAELVLSHLLEIFPDADIYTSVFYQEWNPIFEWRNIHTSFIQKIPFLGKKHKLALFLRPQAFESFDLSEYDIVISSTSAESKWVITKPSCLQVCYCHTPTRYFWSHYEEYLKMMEFGILNPLARFLMPKFIKSLRKWDLVASMRPDAYIANSKNVQKRISKYYERESEVIYPGIDISEFKLGNKKFDFYLSVGRCIPYKQFELLVDTFNQNGKKLILVTNTENKLYRKLKKKSNSNIEWKLSISRQETLNLYSEAKAFIFPPEEDFWIVPLEAMSSWTPVIAYKKWWALETVIDGKSGLFFTEQTVASLSEAINKFQTMKWDTKLIRKHAEKFDKKIFQKQIQNFITKNI